MATKLTEGGLYSVLEWFDEKICKNCSNYRTAKCWPSFTREKENSNHMSYRPNCYEIFMELKNEENNEK